MQDNINSGGESQQSPQPPNEQLGTIYKITNTLNGKGYVGKTRQKLERRISEHKSKSNTAKGGVDAAIRKYGWENFTVEVLETCPVEKMDERERHFIKTLGTKAATINIYNLERNSTYLYNDVLAIHLPVSARPLLPEAFGVTLHRLKFPGSDGYISEGSSW